MLFLPQSHERIDNENGSDMNETLKHVLCVLEGVSKEFSLWTMYQVAEIHMTSEVLQSQRDAISSANLLQTWFRGWLCVTIKQTV